MEKQSKDIINKKEEAFLKKALEYKDKFESTPWWRFKKRLELHKNWQSALDLMIKCGS